MKFSILVMFISFLVNTSHAMAGGFMWTCIGKQFSAEWSGKPVRPISDDIYITYLPENLMFDVKLTSFESTEGKHIFHFDGALHAKPIHVLVTSRQIFDTKLSVFVEGVIVEENIECL